MAISGSEAFHSVLHLANATPAVLGIQGSDPLKTTLVSLVELYLLIMIVYAILSWFPVDPGSGTYRLRWTLGRLIEPVLMPIRRILPQTRLPIDLSFIIVFLGLQIIVVPIIEKVT